LELRSDTIARARALSQLPEKFVIYAIEGKTFAPGEAMLPQVGAAAREVTEAVLAEIGVLHHA
jgi:hypothetical protein